MLKRCQTEPAEGEPIEVCQTELVEVRHAFHQIILPFDRFRMTIYIKKKGSVTGALFKFI